VDDSEGSASGVGKGKGSKVGVVWTMIMDVLVLWEVEVLVGSSSDCWDVSVEDFDVLVDVSVDVAVDVTSVTDERAVSEDRVEWTVVVIWMVEELGSVELSAVAVTVRDGTVTVVKPPPADFDVEVDCSDKLVPDSVVASVAPVVEPSWVEPEPKPEVELVLPSGTAPKTATTVSLGKQRRLTPMVVLSGIAAQTVPSLHPTILQDPSAEQWAYSASTQAYCPGLHAESADILVNAALSLMASAMLEAYCEEDKVVVPVGTVDVITAVGMKSSGVPVGETLLVAEVAEALVIPESPEVSEAVSALVVWGTELEVVEVVIGRPVVADPKFWGVCRTVDCLTGWLAEAWFTPGEPPFCACSDGAAPDCWLDAPPDAREAPAPAVGEYVDEASVEVSAACWAVAPTNPGKVSVVVSAPELCSWAAAAEAIDVDCEWLVELELSYCLCRRPPGCSSGPLRGPASTAADRRRWKKSWENCISWDGAGK
jgi:hypothetical protein